MGHDILLCDDEIHILRDAEFKLTAAGHRVAFIHPKGSFGTLIELVQE